MTEIIFSVILPGSRVLGKFLVRNAVNEVIFCMKGSDCCECDENKYFTAFHRISYKNSPQNSPHFLQKFTTYDFQSLLNLI